MPRGGGDDRDLVAFADKLLGGGGGDPIARTGS